MEARDRAEIAEKRSASECGFVLKTMRLAFEVTKQTLEGGHSAAIQKIV